MILSEKKLPCGCYIEWRNGNQRGGWEISAVSFLCDKGHRQGEVIEKIR